MSSSLTPLGKIVYVCDDVLQDPANGKLHIIGTFDRVRLPVGESFPYRLGRLCVFAQIAGLRGTSIVQARAVDASTGEEVFGSPAYRIPFPGGPAVATVLLRLLDCPFPGPGVYHVQLFC